MNNKKILLCTLCGSAMAAASLTLQAGGATVNHIVDHGDPICVEDIVPGYGLDRVTCTL